MQVCKRGQFNSQIWFSS